MFSSKFRLKSFEKILKFGYSTASERSINKAELVGTLHKRMATSPQYKTYVVLTAEPDNKFYYHMVGTTQMCHDIVGQRVHVAGRINSKNWTEDGKTRQKIHLNSCEIRQLHNDENGDHNNYLNRVQLRAQISSEILNEDNLSRFTLTTARLRREGHEEVAVEYHRVLIRDPPMFQIVRENLNRGDWVDIEGKISYTFWRNSSQKLRASGYILASSVEKYGNKF